MIRCFLCLCWFLSGPLLAFAQEPSEEPPRPMLRTSLDKDTAIPGQPIVYRVTVLVPTWMPKPPVFPSFEAPNVVVRLPSRASTPVSERIKGETWSGISRAYRLYPMQAGQFKIPSGAIALTYADPKTRQPTDIELEVDSFDINGAVPQGAEDLSPFLAARSLKMTRKLEGEPSALTAGDTLTLTLTVSVEGVPPMFIPPSEAIGGIAGLAAYDKAPVLEEKENRGKISGSRVETVTIVAENVGTYVLPEVSLSWFDLDTGNVEIARAPEIDVTVTGPPSVAEPEPDPISWRRLLAWTGLVLAVLFAVIAAARRWGSGIRQRWQHYQEQRRASEAYAYRRFHRALSRKDYSLAVKTGRIWLSRLPIRSGNAETGAFEAAVTELGSCLFDDRMSGTAASPKWQAVERQASALRRRGLSSAKKKQKMALAPLNPSV